MTSATIDRELLELAAKAAGDSIVRGYFGAGECWLTERPVFGLMPWDPLTDDGDALRLAVRLEIGFMSKVSRDASERNVSIAITPYCVSQKRIVEKHNGNPEAATRRAIVLAAAEIGRSMP